MLAISKAIRIARAIASNAVAAVAPGIYVGMTKDTGRGEHGSDDPEAIADYLRCCFDDYFVALDVPQAERCAFLKNKSVLEYGPGDILGVALQMVAYGAEKVYCVDRFPLVSFTEKNLRVIELILSSLPTDIRDRANSCFNEFGDPRSGFSSRRIEYLVRKNGCSGILSGVDLVISRAVLEHVSNLETTFRDMKSSLKSTGYAAHLVDLRSHGFHINSILDFLTWPEWLWQAMYSHKGIPNRWRVNRYRELLGVNGFEILKLEALERANARDVELVKNSLARPFRQVSAEDLSWLNFWMVCRKAA